MSRNRFQREIDAVKASAPGRRFEEAHERHRIDNHAIRISVLAIGVLLTVASAVTFWVPGPNFVLVIVGLAIIAGQWRFAARTFDKLEVVLRRWHEERWEPYPHKQRAIILIWLAVVALLALAVWFAHDQGWLPSWLPFVD